MPRIPEAAFDTNISTRVAAPTATLGPDTAGNLMKAASDFTNAFAQLQDQEERTEALTYASEARRGYLEDKGRLEVALEKADYAGNYRMEDPTDNNPDPTKKRYIEGNINDDYLKMRERYTEAVNGSGKVIRSDIANELIQNQIGDDLIGTKAKAEKILLRKKEAKVADDFIQVLDLSAAAVIEAGSDPSADPRVIEAKAASMRVAISRQLGLARPVVGEEGYRKVQQLADKTYERAAEEIIKTNVNENSVRASQALIRQISNPAARALAGSRLERMKKQHAEVKNVTLANTAIGTYQTIERSPTIDNGTYSKAITQVNNLMTAYTDSNYAGPSREQLDQSALALGSSVVAARVFQKNALEDMQFLTSPDAFRAVSGEIAEGGEQPQAASAQARMREFTAEIEQEIELSGLRVSPEQKQQFVLQTVQEATKRFSNAKANVADLVEANLPPNASFEEKISAINKMAYNNGFGEVPLVSKKERTAFKADFQSALSKSPIEAASYFNSMINKAGAAVEGKSSYRRALAIDLADKDPKLAFLVPSSDLDQGELVQAMNEAAQYPTILKDFNMSEATLDKTLASTKYAEFDAVAGTNFHRGIRQMTLHKAAQYVKQGSSASSAVKEAAEQIRAKYTVQVADDGVSTIVALNSDRMNYNTPEIKNALPDAIEQAKKLPMLSKEDKLSIYNRQKYGRNNTAQYEKSVPDDFLDFYLTRVVTIKPDERYPNVHRVMINGVPLLKSNNETIDIEADELLRMGQKVRDERLKKFGR